MTIEQSNNWYQYQESILKTTLGFSSVKRWTEYRGGNYEITALEVYCSPLLIDEKIEVLKRVWPQSNITGNTNQSYILIKNK